MLFPVIFFPSHFPSIHCGDFAARVEILIPSNPGSFQEELIGVSESFLQFSSHKIEKKYPDTFQKILRKTLGPVLESDMQTPQPLPPSKSGQTMRIVPKRLQKKLRFFLIQQNFNFLGLGDFCEPDSETLTSDTR